MLKCRFHQCLRRGVAVFFQQLFVQTAAVDTDSDGDLLILADIHHSLYPILTANVAGVDTDFAGAAFCSGNGQLIIKVDIRHQRQGAFLTDFRKAPGGLHILNGQPGDLTSGGSQSPNLLQAGLHIGGFGIQHGLNGNGCAVSDGNAPNMNLSCHGNYLINRKIISLNIIKAISSIRTVIPAPWR